MEYFYDKKKTETESSRSGVNILSFLPLNFRSQGIHAMQKINKHVVS
jgi:hypothetical protein